MARNKGTFKFAANFEVKLQGLLDPRGGVTTKDELINKETFPYDGDTIYMTEGMLVTVSSTQEVYMLTNLSKILESDYSGWKRIDAGDVTQLEIVDNLESESSDKVLSAKQGKELKALIDANSAKLTAIYTPKGNSTFEDLPTENTIGDVYNVTNEFEIEGVIYSAGTNVAWTDKGWDPLGGTVDLSAYSTTSEIEGLIKVETERAVAEESRLAQLIQTNSESLLKLSQQVTTHETSIENITKNIGDLNDVLNSENGLVSRIELVEEKNTAQDTRLTNLEKLVTGGEAGEEGTTLLEMVSKNTEDIAQLLTDLTELEKRVKANEEGLLLLNSDSNTEGSVDYKINQALTWEDI